MKPSPRLGSWIRRNAFALACALVAALTVYAVPHRVSEIRAAGGFVIGPPSSTRG